MTCYRWHWRWRRVRCTILMIASNNRNYMSFFFEWEEHGEVLQNVSSIVITYRCYSNYNHTLNSVWNFASSFLTFHLSIKNLNEWQSNDWKSRCSLKYWCLCTCIYLYYFDCKEYYCFTIVMLDRIGWLNMQQLK